MVGNSLWTRPRAVPSSYVTIVRRNNLSLFFPEFRQGQTTTPENVNEFDTCVSTRPRPVPSSYVTIVRRNNLSLFFPEFRQANWTTRETVSGLPTCLIQTPVSGAAVPMVATVFS